jgi:hypothetical protein
MEFARIGTTERTISAERFTHAVDRDEIALLLNCYDCAAPAIYRRRGSNGRRATFAAHHTIEDCPYRSPATEPAEPRHLPPRTPARPTTSLLRVLPAHRQPDAATGSQLQQAPDTEADDSQRTTNRRVPATSRGAVPTRGLRSVLHDLIRDPAYRVGDDKLELPGPGPTGTIRTFVRTACVPSVAAGAAEVDRPRQRLYWGTIRWVGHSGDTYWINTERYETLSIPYPTAEMTTLLRAYGLGDVTDLIEASFISYGWLHRRRDHDGYILRLNSPDWFDIRLPHEDPNGIADRSGKLTPVLGEPA